MRMFLIAVALFVLASCDKGYRVRFANYATERIDSVIIGDKLYFSHVEKQQVTEYSSIKKGTYGVRLVSRNGLSFHGGLHIPGSGSGDRTLQIDAVAQVSVLEK